jgi:hypothetical protein
MPPHANQKPVPTWEHLPALTRANGSQLAAPHPLPPGLLRNYPADGTMRQRVQVPLRTLVRTFDLRIFTIINGFARVEPHTVVLNPNGTPTLVQLASARRMPRQQISALRTTSTGPSLLAELAEHRSRASTPTKRLASPLPDPPMTARCASATNPVEPVTASVIPPTKTQVAVPDETLAHA